MIFLFKYPTGEKPSDVPKDGNFDFEAAENLFFAAQTIQNACGTQAILSVLLNKQGQIEIGSKLHEFKDFTGAFPSEVKLYPLVSPNPPFISQACSHSSQLRGEALSNSELIRDVHNSFARSSPFISEEQRLATEDDDVYHFIAYTPINNTLYELDGLQTAPISHGSCAFEEFPEKVIPVLQRRIERYPAGEIHFNLLAMVKDLRARAAEIGDQDWVAREDRKRVDWQWENALRRHNFLGFVGEVMKGVVGKKLEEGEGEEGYVKWVEGAKEEFRKDMEKKGRKGEDADVVD